MKKQNSSSRLSNLVLEKLRPATGLCATRPSNESLEREIAVEAEDRAMPRASETILVVDDNQAVRALVKRVLEREGYAVLVAANPDEAKKVFMQSPSKITLLLSDVVMPGSDGPDLFRCLRAKYPLKVLYMSGYAHSLASRRHLLDGNRDLLPKPFAPDDLAQRVRETLESQG